MTEQLLEKQTGQNEGIDLEAFKNLIFKKFSIS